MEPTDAFDLQAYLDMTAEDLWDSPVDDADIPKPDGQTLAQAIRQTPEPSATFEGLLAAMPQYRRLFLDVVATCGQPQSDEEVQDLLHQGCQKSRSVYDPGTLCSLLERAGALERVDEQGNPCEDASAEPVLVEEDGEAYLVADAAPAWKWASTDEALAYVQSDDPQGRLREIVAEDAEVAEAYEHILRACAVEEGCAMQDLNSQVNALPSVASQRKRAGYFIDKLERCDAIAWEGSWKITEIGRSLLAAW